MGIPLGYPLESSNHGSDLPIMLLGASLGLWFGSEAVICLCCCCGLMDCNDANCWGVGISCVPPYGFIITYKMN